MFDTPEVARTPRDVYCDGDDWSKIFRWRTLRFCVLDEVVKANNWNHIQKLWSTLLIVHILWNVTLSELLAMKILA